MENSFHAQKSTKLAIIPARGGSKRIPGKNIREFCGKPVIAYSIQAALGSNLFDEVMVSTDDQEIASLAQAYGAVVPFMRSSKNSSDTATTVDVLLEVVEWYVQAGRQFDQICCIYAAAPFVTSKLLQDAHAAFSQKETDALLPMVAFSYPPMRGLVVENGNVQMKWPQTKNMRTQDLETIYHDAGQFYFVKTAALLAEQTLYCKNTIPHYLTELEVQDIDNETDWQLAELKYQLLHK